MTHKYFSIIFPRFSDMVMVFIIPLMFWDLLKLYNKTY